MLRIDGGTGQQLWSVPEAGTQTFAAITSSPGNEVVTSGTMGSVSRLTWYTASTGAATRTLDVPLRALSLTRGAGGLLAAGTSGSGDRLRAVAVDAGGAALWIGGEAIPGVRPVSSAAVVALGPGGRVVAAGRSFAQPLPGDVVVVCLGPDGRTLWSRAAFLPLVPYGSDRLFVRVDGAGDVFVLQGDSNTNTLAKLDGRTGATLWSTSLPTSTYVWIQGLLLTAEGDVVVAGGLSGSWAARRISGRDGHTVWGDTVEPGVPGNPALRSGGELLVPGNRLEALVTVVSAATGQVLRRYRRPNELVVEPNREIYETAVAPDAEGRLLVVAYISSNLVIGGPRLVLLKLDPAGRLVWGPVTQDGDGPFLTVPQMAEDGDHFLLAPASPRDRWRLVVSRYDGQTGALRWRSSVAADPTAQDLTSWPRVKLTRAGADPIVVWEERFGNEDGRVGIARLDAASGAVTAVLKGVTGDALESLGGVAAGAGRIVLAGSLGASLSMWALRERTPGDGDLNLDDRVDVFDLVILAGYLVGNVAPASEPFSASDTSADTNGDGVADVLDLVLLASRVVGNG